jgi:hypothetical protein
VTQAESGEARKATAAAYAGRPGIPTSACTEEPGRPRREQRTEAANWIALQADREVVGHGQDLTFPQVVAVLLGRVDLVAHDGGRPGPWTAMPTSWIRDLVHDLLQHKAAILHHDLLTHHREDLQKGSYISG